MENGGLDGWDYLEGVSRSKVALTLQIRVPRERAAEGTEPEAPWRSKTGREDLILPLGEGLSERSR